MVVNSGDPREVRNAKRKEKRREGDYDAGLQWILKAAQGRDALWKIIVEAGFFETTANAEPHLMYWENGQREVAKRIVDWIVKLNPQAWIQMQADYYLENQLDDMEEEQEKEKNDAGE